MVLKWIIQFFMARHSEETIRRLSELPVMRRAAQLTALVILQLTQRLKDPQLQARIASFSMRLKQNLKEELDRAKTELQKGGKKS